MSPSSLTAAVPDRSTSPTETPVITVAGLTKSYGDREVLCGLSFQVSEQEIFGILGPNGAGKTTAVEIMQGLRRGGGAVRVLGLDPAQDRTKLRRLVGSQLQAAALPDRLRVGEALRLFARIAGDVVDWRVLRDDWDLARIERSAFGDLSGGERQRLFIALALVNRPSVVFLDELTQGLDPAARRETWRLIRRVREHGATVVLVSHFMDEVEHLCDRVAVLYGGRITACGTPAELVAGVGGSIRTRFTTDRVDVCDALAALPGVEGVHRRPLPPVRPNPPDTAVEVTGDAASPVLVAAELARHQLTPADFAVVRPSLEDVFVTLTSGGPR